MQVTIGVLALQGAFTKHLQMIQSLGIDCIEVRTAEDLNHCHGLIIPGGESTTIAKLLTKNCLWKPLQKFSKKHPIFGTCAGMILMANEVVGNFKHPSLNLLDITIKRNAYGRQTESFHTNLAVNLGETEHRFNGLFIRAPKLESWGKKMHLLATWEGVPVLLQNDIYLGASFHPELTKNPLIHRYFLNLVRNNQPHL